MLIIGPVIKVIVSPENSEILKSVAGHTFEEELFKGCTVCETQKEEVIPPVTLTLRRDLFLFKL